MELINLIILSLVGLLFPLNKNEPKMENNEETLGIFKSNPWD